MQVREKADDSSDIPNTNTIYLEKKSYLNLNEFKTNQIYIKQPSPKSDLFYLFISKRIPTFSTFNDKDTAHTFFPEGQSKQIIACQDRARPLPNRENVRAENVHCPILTTP